jgi:hypothetical protein
MARAEEVGEQTWWVACLCAAWCGVCRDWQDAFVELARAHPQVRFAWIDVEDEDETMGDVDIETFPTVLVARGMKALFLGPVQPSAAGLSRLLTTLQAEPAPAAGVPGEADALARRVATTVLARNQV